MGIKREFKAGERRIYNGVAIRNASKFTVTLEITATGWLTEERKPRRELRENEPDYDEED